MLCIFTFESLIEQCKCNATRGFSLISKGIKSFCSFIVILIYIYNGLSMTFCLLIISWSKLLYKLVKTIYFALILKITCILPNLSMSEVILKQLLQVFSSSLKFLVIIKSWEQSLHILDFALSMKRSRWTFFVSMFNPSFDIQQ